MILRQADFSDFEFIKTAILNAQLYLKGLGIDQWQDGYPDVNVLIEDLSNKESFVVENEFEQVMGYVALSEELEDTYENIDGQWITNSNKYGVIHRMAVINEYRGRGVARFIFRTYEEILRLKKIKSIRIDTHPENFGMQKLVSLFNYQYCGIIYVRNNSKRLAYEKIIS